MIELRYLKHLSDKELSHIAEAYEELWLSLCLYDEQSNTIDTEMWQARNLYRGCRNELERRK